MRGEARPSQVPCDPYGRVRAPGASPRGAPGRAAGNRRGFTLFEMILTVMIVGIVGVIVVPAVSSATSSPGLRTAANMLAADIEYAQSACINNPNAMVVLRVDPSINKYWIASATNLGAAIASPADGQPYENDFATGRSSRMRGVVISQVRGAGSTGPYTVAFDAFGRVKGAATAVIVLENNGSSLSITIDGPTGEVTID